MHPTIATCMRLIDSGQTIFTSFKCFPSIRQAEKDGIIPIPLPNEPHIGNHAVNVIGYSTKDKLFKFINSYGKEWGDNGFGYIPFYYYENNLILEMYIVDFEEVQVRTPMQKHP